jgi:hypothetical protein
MSYDEWKTASPPEYGEAEAPAVDTTWVPRPRPAMSPELTCSCGVKFSAPVQAVQKQDDGTALGFATHPACNSTRCWEVCLECDAPIADDGCCTRCGVSYSHEPCGSCKLRGYHARGCPESDGDD